MLSSKNNLEKVKVINKVLVSNGQAALDFLPAESRTGGRPGVKYNEGSKRKVERALKAMGYEDVEQNVYVSDVEPVHFWSEEHKMALQYMGRRDRLQDGKSGIKLQMKGRVVEA